MSGMGEVSDGYHTFNELYHHRFILTKALFNLDTENCLKSQLHDDGTMFDNYFIVGINTELGWATYHYPIASWRDFHCKEVERFPKWDGHDSTESINRIGHHFSKLTKKDECRRLEKGIDQLQSAYDDKCEQLRERDEKLAAIYNLLRAHNLDCEDLTKYGYVDDSEEEE